MHMKGRGRDSIGAEEDMSAVTMAESLEDKLIDQLSLPASVGKRRVTASS